MNHPIYIGFSTTQHTVSRLIRWFTQSKTSHVWVRYYDCCLGHWMVVGASFTGLNIELYEKYRKKVEIVAEFAGPESLDLSLQTLSTKLGQEYDFAALFGSAWVQIMRRWFKVKILNPWRDASKYICSEFIFYLFKGAGLKTFTEVDGDTVSPDDLFKFCSMDANFKLVRKD